MNAGALIALAALGLQASEEQVPVPVSREAASTLPPGRLFELLSRQAAPLIAEVERPTFHGMTGPNGLMRILRFATPPRRQIKDLCAASIIGFVLDSQPGYWDAFIASPETTVAREHVSDVTAWQAYKVVPADLGCESGGRVLPEGSRDFGQRRYFTAQGIDPWPAVLAFRAAIEASGRDPVSAAHCRADAGGRALAGCASPADIIRSLDLDALIYVLSEPCPQDRALRCVVGGFTLGDPDRPTASYRISVPAETAAAYVSGVRLLGPVEIAYEEPIVE